MAKIRTKLKQLRDADVRFISLVDRAATRIPFRVLKRDEKENKMGIDLTKVFKIDRFVRLAKLAIDGDGVTFDGGVEQRGTVLNFELFGAAHWNFQTNREIV